MKKKYIAFNIAIITVALLLFFGFGISVTRSNLYDEAGRIITEITDVYVNNYTTPQNAVKHTSRRHPRDRDRQHRTGDSRQR